jgi:hypothetical protein
MLAFVVSEVIVSLALGQVFEVLKLLVRDGLGAPVAGGALDAAIQLHCAIHLR